MDNGLLQRSVDTAGVTNTYRYGLRRRVGTVDPRTGLATFVYNGKNQIVATIDAGGFTNGVAYDTDTGEVVTRTAPNGKQTHFRHDLRGQLTHKWGATYPVEHIHDAYGQMTEDGDRSAPDRRRGQVRSGEQRTPYGVWSKNSAERFARWNRR